jgi:hypothetical protein
MPYPLSDQEARRVITTGMSDTEVLRILQDARAPRERRATQTFELEHATRFSDDELMKDDVFLVEQLMDIPELWEPLRIGTTDPDQLEREETGRASRVGTSRMQGDIAPIAVSYLAATKPEMQHFHHKHRQSKIWELANWQEVPSYVTFWNRITEAEKEHIPAWEQASRFCWTAVRRYVPDAGLHWVIDATAYESHVLAHHDCPDKEKCAAAGGTNMPEVIQRAGMEEINTERHAKQKEAPEDDNAEPLALDGELTRESLLSELDMRLRNEDFEEVALDETYPEPEMPKYRRKRPKKQPGEKLQKEIWVNDGPKSDPNTSKHRYIVRDPEAGFRIYRRPDGKKFRQWLGGFAITITDLTTGCQIAQFHIPGDQNEHTAYLDVLALGVRMTGRLPQNVITDRAYNTRRIRQINALLGIGQISPWRKPHPTVKKRADKRKDTHDEYGIPTCKYCGGPGLTVGKKDHGYEIRRGKAVVRYRCAAPIKDICRRKLQRYPFEREWLLFGVVSREDPLYYELRGAARPYERAHQNSRTRTGQAGNDLTSRPKRIGIDFMAYRAAVGAFLDVFRLCLRHGWLGSHPQPRAVVLKRREGGEEAVASVRRKRERAGLLLPRGKVAEKLGLVFQGLLPDGYKTIRERKRQRTIAAKKAAEEKKAAKKASSTTKGKAKPPPDAPAA